jgi:hypothetical protein
MRSVLVLAGLLAAVLPAAASGGLSCSLEDPSVRIAIESGVTRGMGGPVFNFRGTLEILDKAVAEDLRKTEFDGRHLPQYWLSERALQLHLYREREGDKPHGYVDLVIETQAGDDEGLYGGSYRLTVYDMAGVTTGEGKTTELSGEINCFAE